MNEIIAQFALLVFAALWIGAFLKARDFIKADPKNSEVLGFPLNMATLIVLAPAVGLAWLAISLR